MADPPPPEPSAEPRIFKIIVVGDSNVGKTCLTYRFCEGAFPSITEATIGVDFKEKKVELGDEILRLQIWDTAGQERFRKSMVTHYYRNAAAVVFVYDVTRENSFRSLPSWLQEAETHLLGDNIPRLIVGNKMDLEGAQQISRQRAQKFADSNDLPLFEVSSKSDSSQGDINSIFMTIAHKLKQNKPLIPHSRDQPIIVEVDQTSKCC